MGDADTALLGALCRIMGNALEGVGEYENDARGGCAGELLGEGSEGAGENR